jgi:hypothetical protein
MSDRFVAPRPTFHKSNDLIAIEITTPKHKDHSPSPNVVQRLRDEDKIKLAEMVARIQAEAKQKRRSKSITNG